MSHIFTLPKQFDTEPQARKWLFSFLNEQDMEHADNYRFAFEDTPKEVAEYDTILNDGCCGYFDRRVKVAGRYALIGCNYGH